VKAEAFRKKMDQDFGSSFGDLDTYYATIFRRLREKGAASSTVEALMYELRTYGAAALAGPNCRRRLCDLSQPQLVEVVERLMALRPKYHAITDELLFLLGEQLS
jgi:hypothetical protein